MSVKIQLIAGDLIQVNGKSIYKDMEGNWCTHQELTSAEGEAFIEFKNNIKNPKDK